MRAVKAGLAKRMLWGAAGLGVLAAVASWAWRTAAPDRPAAATRPARVLARESRNLMGTTIVVSVVVPSEEEGRRALDLAFAQMEKVDRMMSEYRPDSELSQINRTAAEGPVRVSPEMRFVLEVSLEVSRLSDGAFDVTCGPIVELWRTAGKRGSVPTDAERAEVLTRVGYKHLIVDSEAGTVKFAVPGMTVLLGSIAKGYAADLSIAALRQHGYTDALVQAGGCVMASGLSLAGKPWRVGVQDPRFPDDQRFIAVANVTNCAIDTSGNYRRFVTIGGRHYSHVVDPRTAWPVDAVPTTTIVTTDAIHADALSTATGVLGLERGLRLVESRPDTECLMGVTEHDEMVLHTSKGWSKYTDEP
jgi:thiamine biosynthesis lipoprotein